LSLKPDKNNGYYKWRPIYIFGHISLSSSRNEKMSQTKVVEKNQNTHFVFSNFFFSLKNRAFYEIMWINIVEPGRPQTTI